MKSIIKAIFSAFAAILSKIAKFFMSIPSWLVALFKKIGSIKKPSWFQWNFFPKDGQPPTQSILEITVYILVFYYCFNLFIDFNRIPNTEIIVDAEKLNDYRFLSNSSTDDSTFYLHYQIAEIKVVIPRKNTDKIISFSNIDESGGISGQIYSDSMKLSCKKEINNRIHLLSKLNPFWYVVYSQAAKETGFTPEFLFKKPMYIAGTHEIWMNFPKTNHIPSDLKRVKELVSNSKEMKNFYHIKMASKIDKNIEIKEIDTTWFSAIMTDSIKYSTLYETGSIKQKFYEQNIICNRQGVEQAGGFSYNYLEQYICNNTTQSIVDKYNQVFLTFFEGDNPQEWGILETVKAFFAFTLYGHLGRNLLSSLEKPSWMERHDFSQGWYKFNLNSASIDSIRLIINFEGATDFYPIKINPDVIGSNYIQYSDSNKILQIKKEGLEFYAKFKELENRQTIRCFALTAILSGLLIIILTFIIIGLYRALKVIGTRILRKQ